MAKSKQTKIYRAVPFNRVQVLSLAFVLAAIGTVIIYKSEAATNIAPVVVLPSSKVTAGDDAPVLVKMRGGHDQIPGTTGTVTLNGAQQLGTVFPYCGGFYYQYNGNYDGLDLSQYPDGTKLAITASAYNYTSATVNIVKDTRNKLKPKLKVSTPKSPSDITAKYLTSPNQSVTPECQTIISYHTGLVGFRNPEGAGITAAVTMTPLGTDFNYDGLHLTPDAARQLVGYINTALAGQTTGYLEIDHHDTGAVTPWETFTVADAQTIASNLTTVAAGH